MADARTTLLQVLAMGVSHDPRQANTASAQLDQWENEKGFYSTLLDIANDRSAPGSAGGGVDVQRRTLAIIRFKNGMDKRWRRGASWSASKMSIIDDEEKARIRSMLFSCLDEPDRTIALQASVAVAKIARHDYPAAWADLFNPIQQALTTSLEYLSECPSSVSSSSFNPAGPSVSLMDEQQRQREYYRLVLVRASDLLYRIIKEFAEMKLTAGRMRMAELTRLLFPFVSSLYARTLQLWLPDDYALLSSSEFLSAHLFDPHRAGSVAGRAEEIRATHLMLKTLGQLACSMLGNGHRRSLGPRQSALAEEDGDEAKALVEPFFETALTHMQSVGAVRRHLVAGSRTTPSGAALNTGSCFVTLTKFLQSFSKLFIRMQDRNKVVCQWSEWSVLSALALEIVNTAATEGQQIGDRMDSMFTTPVITNCLVIIKVTIEQLPAFSSEDMASLAEGMFSPTLTQQVAELLVGHLMLMDEEHDLEMWMADPEGWFAAQRTGEEGWDLSVRTCAERVLMALVDKRPQLIGELVWTKFQQSASLSNELRDVLLKDSIYTAVGRCVYKLPEGIDYDALALQRLIPEASQNVDSLSLRILRRRVAWLFECLSEMVTHASMASICAALVSMISPSDANDAAVRLTAAVSLRGFLDALHFDPESFTPLLGDAVENLASLLVQEVENVVTGSGALAASKQLEEVENVATVSNTVTILVERVGKRIIPFAEHIARLIPGLWSKDDPSFKSKPYLLSLVEALVKALGEHAVELDALVATLVQQSNVPAFSVHLAEDAILLWKAAVKQAPRLSPQLSSLIPLACSLLETPDRVPDMCKILEAYVLLSPSEVLEHAGQPLLHAVAAMLADLPQGNDDLKLPLAHLLDVLVQAAPLDKWLPPFGSTDIMPRVLTIVLQDRDSPVVITPFIVVVSRMAHADPSAFHQLVALSAAKLGRAEDEVWGALIEQWANKFENMSTAKKRKMSVIGLTSLLVHTTNPAILGRIPDMATVWSDVLADIKESERGDAAVYHRSTTATPSVSSELEDTSANAQLREALAAKDPVHNVKLTHYISSAIQAAQSLNGGSQEFMARYLSQMDALVLDQLQRDLAMG